MQRGNNNFRQVQGTTQKEEERKDGASTKTIAAKTIPTFNTMSNPTSKKRTMDQITGGLTKPDSKSNKGTKRQYRPGKVIPALDDN